MREGLLILDELRENMMSDDFSAKEYLLMGMEWVCDGMEPEYIKICMENMIDNEDDKATKVLAHLYMTALRCIQLNEPSGVDLRQRYFASLFPIKAYDRLYGIMKEFTASKRQQRRIAGGINLLMLHYDAGFEEELDKYLSEIPLNKFKEIYRCLKSDDIITILLISSEQLHERILNIMTNEYKAIIENSQSYACYIRNQRIKDVMNTVRSICHE